MVNKADLVSETGEALFQADWGEYAERLPYQKPHYEELARAAIATIRKAMTEPTPEMTELLGDQIDLWNKIIAASPIG